MYARGADRGTEGIAEVDRRCSRTKAAMEEAMDGEGGEGMMFGGMMIVGSGREGRLL